MRHIFTFALDEATQLIPRVLQFTKVLIILVGFLLELGFPMPGKVNLFSDVAFRN